MKTEDDVTSCCKGSLGGFSALSSPLMTRNARHGGPSLPSDEKIIVEGFTLNDKKILYPVDERLRNVKRENPERNCSYRNSYHSDTRPNQDVGSGMASPKAQDIEDVYKSNKSRNNVKMGYSTSAARNESFRVPPRSLTAFKSRSRSLERLPRKTHRLTALEAQGEPTNGQNESSHLAKQDFSRFQGEHVAIKVSTPQFSGIPFVCGMRKQSPYEHFPYMEQQGLELDAPYHAFSFRGNAGHAQSNSHLSCPLRFGGDKCARLNRNSQLARELDSRHHKQSFSQGSPHQRGYCRDHDDSHHLFPDDEEPVWKQYQWYRDKKRPPSQQIRPQRAEQTIFMQYNEIRHKRFSRGRVVYGRGAPGSAPVPHFHSDKNAPVPSRCYDSSCYSSGEEDNSTSACFRRRRSDEAKEEYHSIVAGIADGNLKKSIETRMEGRQETKSKILEHGKAAAVTAAFSPEIISRSSYFSYSDDDAHRSVTTPGSDESDGPNAQLNEAQEEINSITSDDAVFFPRKAWRSGNDVAKTMRLNRIVRAMKNVKKRQQSFGAQDEYQGTKRMKSVSYNNGVGGDSSIVEQKLIGKTETEKVSGKRQKATANDTYGYSSVKKRLLKARDTVRCSDLSSLSDASTSGSEQESVPANGLTASVSEGNDEDVVCQVNGLLALPGFKETKFNITLGELKRRVNPPETLTRVEMISYVRQAKSSGRILLDKNNITTANRSNPTILSRVCEGEAQIMADKIHKMNKHYLPLTTLARKTVEAYKDHSCEVKDCDDCRLKLRRRIVDVEITRNSLRELHKSIDDMRKKDELQTFELASHNFGVANICNNLSLLDDYFKVLLLTLQDE